MSRPLIIAIIFGTWSASALATEVPGCMAEDLKSCVFTETIRTLKSRINKKNDPKKAKILLKGLAGMQLIEIGEQKHPQAPEDAWELDYFRFRLPNELTGRIHIGYSCVRDKKTGTRKTQCKYSRSVATSKQTLNVQDDKNEIFLLEFGSILTNIPPRRFDY